MQVPSFQLLDGTTIPAIGLGCWMGSYESGPRVYEMCRKALQLGYRHFDTAAYYGSEAMLGKAIRDSGVPRNEVYITTKLATDAGHRVKKAFDESLNNLDTDYIDLFLIHWPQVGSYTQDGKVRAPSEGYPELVNVWKEMEKLVDTGKVKSLGVSNFSIKTLSALLPHCKILPVTNQVEMHPCLPQEDLKAFCEEKNVLITAYSPLGRSTLFFESPVIKGIAEKRGATPAQVVLSWGVQRGTIVIPKSENEDRLRANVTLIKLPEEDMKTINEFHLRPGMHRSMVVDIHEPDGTVAGWTYDQLGWNMTVGGFVAS